MKLQDLIMDFLRENGLKLTERYLDEGRDLQLRSKLIRFVHGNSKYSIVFSNEEPILHLFKEKLWKRRPYGSVAAVSGGQKIPGRSKITVDLNNRDSFKQILDFL